MTFSIKKEKNIVIVSLTGRMDANVANEVENTCDALIDEGKKNFLFELSKLEYISSAGLRVLLSIARILKKEEDAHVKISGVNNYVREVFDVTGFTPIFDIYDNEKEAVDDF